MSCQLRSALIIGLSLAVLGSSPRSMASAQVDEFQELLEKYRSSQADEAVSVFAAWPASQVERVAATNNRLSGDPWRSAATALFHTEAGFRGGTLGRKTRFDTSIWGLAVTDQPLPPGGLQTVEDLSANEPHFRSAYSIVRLLADLARQRQDAKLLNFARDWTRAVASLRAQLIFNTDLDIVFARGFVADPLALQLVAAWDEALMGPWTEERPYPYGGWLTPLKGWEYSETLTSRYGRFYKYLARDSESYFRRALAADPNSLEARLRLGRVLMLLGQPEGRQMLEATLRDATQRQAAFEGYLAAMFLAQLHEDAGDDDAAIAMYRQAHALDDAAPAAHLGIADRLVGRGELSAGWAEARSIFGEPGQIRQPKRDPWCIYRDLEYRHVNELFADLRRMVGAGPTASPIDPSEEEQPTQFGGLSSPAPLASPVQTAANASNADAIRRNVEGVRLDVAVMANGRPLEGLSPSDFEVRDNGTLQALDAATRVTNVAVMIVLDTSASTRWPLNDGLHAVSSITRALRPGDLVSLMTVDDHLAWRVRWSPRPDDAVEALRGLSKEARAKTALWDGVFAATAVAAVAPSQPLIMIVSDGGDSASWLTRTPRNQRPSELQDRLFDLIRRAGVAVDAIWLPYRDGTPDECFGRMAGDAIARATFGKVYYSATPGKVYDITRARLEAEFAKRLDELRTRYVLTYTPRGVKVGDGWHKLSVGITSKKGTVTTRPSYYSGK